MRFRAMNTTESELPVPSSMSSPTSDSAHVGRQKSLELELVAVSVACCCLLLLLRCSCNIKDLRVISRFFSRRRGAAFMGEWVLMLVLLLLGRWCLCLEEPVVTG